MGTRGLRADAQRNRAAIMAAARELIAARGIEVGMDDIAAGAGVAVGTLYRHFPTKNDLVAAIVADLGEVIAQTLDSAEARIGSGSSALDELVALLHRVVVDMGQDRLLRDAIADVEALRDVRARARDTVRRLVDSAREEGSLHPDVTVDDVVLLLTTSPGAETPKAARLRWVELAERALTFGRAVEPR